MEDRALSFFRQILPANPRNATAFQAARWPRVTLDVQPAYEVEQRVYEGLSWDAVERDFEEIASIANSVSFFTHWGDIVEQVWVKRRTDEPAGEPAATTDPHLPSGVTRSIPDPRA